MKHFIFVPVLSLLVFCPLSAGAQTNIESLLKKSAEYEQQDKLDEAVGELTKAIAVQPDNADLYLRRADLYRFLSSNELLAADANKAVSLNPDNKQIILTAARLLRNIQQCAESISILNAYIYKNAESDDVVFARSYGNICLGDWASAYQDAVRAVELNPKNNSYRTAQAGLLARLGDSANSAAQFTQLIKTLETKLTKTVNEGQRESFKRDLAGVYRTRAGVYHSKADTAAEFADLAKFIEYSPQDFSYRMRGKIYQDHQMYSEAIADFTEAIRLSPAQAIFLLERGDVFAAAKKYDEAVKDYEQSLKLDSTLKEIVEQRMHEIKARNKSVK